MINAKSARKVDSKVDEVEVRDNGVKVGSAALIGGEWSYPATGLPIGRHSFTAHYEGKTAAAWVLDIQPPTHLDDFEDAPVGAFRTIQRPYFNGVVTVTGGSYAFWTPAQITNVPRRLQLYANANSLFYYFDTALEMTFNELYSEITFWGNSVAAGNGNGKIEALNQSGVVIQTVQCPPSATFNPTFGSPGKGEIKSLRFVLRHGSVDYAAQDYMTLQIDDLRLTK
ncbi:hypothetical protein ACI2KS_08760 [Pseudomonas sp. NPDC087358]|uniref:hypothetical protein n=1 Tax=Pseudomonas sp. NPDC087358 TaxID=3364439 RepID=UPI0038510629